MGERRRSAELKNWKGVEGREYKPQRKIQEEQEIIVDNKGMAGPYMRNGWDDAAE